MPGCQVVSLPGIGGLQARDSFLAASGTLLHYCGFSPALAANVCRPFAWCLRVPGASASLIRFRR
jgi:hypothetical protein